MKKFSLYSDIEKAYREIKICTMIIAGSWTLGTLVCACMAFYFKDYFMSIVWLIGFGVCCALSYFEFKED